MRTLRLLIVTLLLLVGAGSVPAATTTALDPLIDAVLTRRSSMETVSRHDRRIYKALGKVAHELATPTTTIAGELRVVSAAIDRLRSSLKSEVSLRSLASEALANLGDKSRDERNALALWTGRLADIGQETRLASGLAEADRLFARAQSRKSEATQALLLARGCEAIDRTRADLALVGDPPVMPDFSIPDVNPASASYGLNVSPRDYEDKISAWYFGKAG